MNNKIEPTYVTFEQSKWLFEKDYISRSEARYGVGTHILYKDAHINDKEDDGFCSTPQKAYSAAFDYVLNNLI